VPHWNAKMVKELPILIADASAIMVGRDLNVIFRIQNNYVHPHHAIMVLCNILVNANVPKDSLVMDAPVEIAVRPDLTVGQFRANGVRLMKTANAIAGRHIPELHVVLETALPNHVSMEHMIVYAIAFASLDFLEPIALNETVAELVVSLVAWIQPLASVFVMQAILVSLALFWKIRPTKDNH